MPPLPVVGMQDEFLHLADGRRIIDAISSWWTIQHGHRHPRLIKALKDATDKYDHVIFAGATHPPAEELADLLLMTTPWWDGKVFFSDNGSTAVEVALKMAYQYWDLSPPRPAGERGSGGEGKRRFFVSFTNGYHGDTFGAMAVGRDPVFFGRFEPFLFKNIQIPLEPGRLEETLESQADSIAAVIIEPLVQGAGGMRMHTPLTLKIISDLCRQHNVILIVDEVMTGGGRTGTFWAYEQAHIQPDIICSAKTIAGGMMPLAATLVSPKIVEPFLHAERKDTFFHGHSFTAHPLACAVGVENLKLMNGRQWKNDVQRIESFWKRELAQVTSHHRVIEVRIRGSIAAIELDIGGGYLSDLGPRTRQKALEMGVLLRPLGNVIYAMPPFCTSDATLGRIADAMGVAIRSSSS